MSKTRLSKSTVDQSFVTRHMCGKVLVVRPDELCVRLMGLGVHLVSQYVANRQRLLTQRVLGRSELVEFDSYITTICPAARTPLRRGTGPLSGADPRLQQAVESVEKFGLMSVMSYILARDHLIDRNLIGACDAELLDDHVLELSESWPEIEAVGARDSATEMRSDEEDRVLPAVKIVFSEDGWPVLSSLQ